jgi:CTP:phosphocholine cytidylyltransferase-like protein
MENVNKFKSNKYNLYLIENNDYYIYNQLSGTLSKLDKELYLLIKDSDGILLKRPLMNLKKFAH